MCVLMWVTDSTLLLSFVGADIEADYVYTYVLLDAYNVYKTQS